jgi:hypothetical protein
LPSTGGPSARRSPRSSMFAGAALVLWLISH